MFTGIVEEIGTVAELNPSDSTGGTSLTITLPPTSTLLSDAHLGDSIAINGVCLTVTSFTTPSPASSAEETPSFTVGIAPETLRLTNLGSLTPQSRVNLERAVRADTRMGGHFVQGHVDATATILSRTPDGNAVTLRFAPRLKEVLRYVVHKGFVALDGASLTVTRVDDEAGWWEVMLIAYTQERIVTAAKAVGDTVNVEVDMTAKYVEKSLRGYLAGLSSDEAGGGGLLEKIVERVVKGGSA
ncbi:Lumazine-binding protein [Parathielavia hyrcaniae]|uniref:Riboflavin synthase n=1 Tax=Parathielavia hyrcaniae TaxID=113614 RepID=A0AAN6Q865_9PEZI|nr:Lumazine-binding protein [Parathielavia hyrcaniae]